MNINLTLVGDSPEELRSAAMKLLGELSENTPALSPSELLADVRNSCTVDQVRELLDSMLPEGLTVTIAESESPAEPAKTKAQTKAKAKAQPEPEPEPEPEAQQEDCAVAKSQATEILFQLHSTGEPASARVLAVLEDFGVDQFSKIPDDAGCKLLKVAQALQAELQEAA